jgi:drug/metabolite transporter (DMT)-like permease
MLHFYVLHYPMTPYGGVFIATVGVCVIAGAVLRKYRDNLVWIGFALGAVLLFAFGGILSRGLHSPSLLQVSFLALAILLELPGSVI